MSLFTSIVDRIADAAFGFTLFNQVKDNAAFAVEALSNEHDVNLLLSGSTPGQASHAPLAGRGIDWNALFDLNLGEVLSDSPYTLGQILEWIGGGNKYLHIHNGPNNATAIWGRSVNIGASGTADIDTGWPGASTPTRYADGVSTSMSTIYDGTGAFSTDNPNEWHIRREATGHFRVRCPPGWLWTHFFYRVNSTDAPTLSRVYASSARVLDIHFHTDNGAAINVEWFIQVLMIGPLPPSA